MLTPFYLAAPVAVFTGVFAWAGGSLTEVLRLVAALGALATNHAELALALAGLVLLRGNGSAALDGAALGWGFMAAARAAAAWTSPHSPLVCWLLGAGALLLGGVWPFSASWRATDEGWGRRIGRGIIAVHALAVTLPSSNAVVMDVWAPWAVFLPGVGVLWAGALVLVPSRQQSNLTLLWFFELQMMALVCLGTRGLGLSILAVLAWAAILPIAMLLCMAASSRGSAGSSSRERALGGLALASVLGIPGAVGFAARFLAVSSLLSASPAGLVCYVAGLLIVPAFLRPLRDEMLGVRLSNVGLVACGMVSVAVLVLGIAPGLASGDAQPIWLWRFLLNR